MSGSIEENRFEEIMDEEKQPDPIKNLKVIDEDIEAFFDEV